MLQYFSQGQTVLNILSSKRLDLILIYQVETSDDPVSHLLGLLGIEALIGELIGINCSPITVIGLGGTNCEQQTLCCTGESYVSIEYLSYPLLPGLMVLLSPQNGGTGASSLINIGCSPIDIVL